MELELNEFDRRPFTVVAVEVTLTNIEQVAEWCKGTLDKETSRIQGMNTTIELPVIRIQGQGRDSDRVFTATIGCFVVNHKGNFRMYKPVQFRDMFVAKPKPAISFKVPDASSRADAAVAAPIFQLQDDGMTVKPVD